jgi:predicted nuclease of predicted toxin-antitoxin system
MMRLLADENISRLVVDRLRAAGFDVTAIGATNAGASDVDVLAIASREGRLLITEDRDFGELIIRQRLEVQGIILLELDRLSNEAEADLVVAVVSANADKLAGNLLVIEPTRVRVRPLIPVREGK